MQVPHGRAVITGVPTPPALSPPWSRGCPLSPQHWQRRLTWACPTGASSTSPSHCEWRHAHPSPARSGSLSSSWLGAHLTDKPATGLWDQPSLAAAPRHPAALQKLASLSPKLCTQGTRCLPGGRGGQGSARGGAGVAQETGRGGRQCAQPREGGRDSDFLSLTLCPLCASGEQTLCRLLPPFSLPHPFSTGVGNNRPGERLVRPAACSPWR